MNYKNFLALIRYQQYIKNIFIFLPLFFAGQITNLTLLNNTIIAFIAFSFVASSVYIFNDLQDIVEDKKHPTKKYRPLASGFVTKKPAILLIVVMLAFACLLMILLPINTIFIIGLYLILNIAYSLYIKHIAILDITAIAIGFVLRLFIGATVANVALSAWIVVMTFLLALFLALAKRRDDMLFFINDNKKMRTVIDGYSLKFIDSMITVVATIVIISYIVYTTSTDVMASFGSNYLYLSALFVILGIMRYMQITFVEKKSGSPTKIALNDRFIQVTIVAWTLYFIFTIYL